MEALFEVVILPVSDAGRSLRFYRDQLGFTPDVDYAAMTPIARKWPNWQTRRIQDHAH
jgi:catechol 2,3-dioxygenase-like lactoylglutathione lyase family enzyme